MKVVSNPDGLSEKLKNAVNRPDLQRMARNPLLLTVMAVVHANKGELPDARSLLYENVVDLLLFKWETVKLNGGEEEETDWRILLKEAGLNDIDIKGVLWEIAFNAHGGIKERDGEATADIPEHTLHSSLRKLHPDRSLDWADKMLRIMKLRAGLLLENRPAIGASPQRTPHEVSETLPDRPAIYGFPHRTFEEYLAACHLCTMSDFTGKAVELAGEGAFWREVILLAVGRLVHQGVGIEKPLFLVSELCPEKAPAMEDDRGWHNAWMAGQCLIEIGLERAGRREFGRTLIERLRERLVELVSGGLLKPRERADAGVVLGRLGDGRKGVGSKNNLPDIHWVPVPAGPFIMGSDVEDAHDDENPQFECGLIKEPFRISRYPVTVAQYQCFEEAGGYEEERYWTASGWSWLKKGNVISGPENYEEIYQIPNHPHT